MGRRRGSTNLYCHAGGGKGTYGVWEGGCSLPRGRWVNKPPQFTTSTHSSGSSQHCVHTELETIFWRQRLLLVPALALILRLRLLPRCHPIHSTLKPSKTISVPSRSQRKRSRRVKSWRERLRPIPQNMNKPLRFSSPSYTCPVLASIVPIQIPKRSTRAKYLRNP